ncbi:epimerase chloroplastic-like, partial [Raphidocelis subcapitata]
WTPDIKRQIKTSRIDTTTKIAAAISAAPEGQRPKVFLSSSAVGYYGTSSTGSFTEDSPAGVDYLAAVCAEWEAAAQKARGGGGVPPGVRVVLVRTGIVLARDGGVLARMLPIFELFAGGPLGTGKQWMSWIHRDDLVDLMIEMLRNPAYSGAYNGTAPKPVTMAQLCSSVGGVLGRPSWLPVPDFALNTLLGEGASVVLEGQKVLPSRTQQQGFRFKYSEIDSALRQLLK